MIEKRTSGIKFVNEFHNNINVNISKQVFSQYENIAYDTSQAKYYDHGDRYRDRRHRKPIRSPYYAHLQIS